MPLSVAAPVAAAVAAAPGAAAPVAAPAGAAVAARSAMNRGPRLRAMAPDGARNAVDLPLDDGAFVAVVVAAVVM